MMRLFPIKAKHILCFHEEEYMPSLEDIPQLIVIEIWQLRSSCAMNSSGWKKLILRFTGLKRKMFFGLLFPTKIPYPLSIGDKPDWEGKGSDCLNIHYHCSMK